MAKLTTRTLLNESPASGDLFHVVDVSDSTDSADGTSKRVTYSNLVPDASATVKGKVELATDAETITGTDTARAITPANYKNAFDETLPSVTNAASSKSTPVDADEIPLVDSAASNVLKKLTWSNLKATLLTYLNSIVLKHSGPQGFANNYKISVTDTGSGLTVALKTLAGTDPSASDPVYIRIGDTVRTVSAALSVTAADGTNWCNSGGTELATQEADYFVYLGYNATDGVVLGFSRYADAKQYSEFSATSTNQKYCRISTITNAASTDYYQVIGRFAATLSAGAGYTWSVPTYTAINLIQRPIYQSRWLTWVPAWTGYSAAPSVVCKYRVEGGRCWLDMRLIGTGTSNATSNKFSVPFTQAMPTEARVCVGWGVNNGSNLSNVPRLEFDGSADFNFQLDGAGNPWTSSGAKYVGVIGFSYEI